MNGFKTALRALMLLSLLIGVAACGDDDDTNTESDANAESTDSSDGQSADAPATEAEMIEVKGATFLTSQSSADRKSTRLKLQSLMRISYAVFRLKKKNTKQTTINKP